MSFDFTFTRLAAAFAEAKSSTQEVTAEALECLTAVQKEIDTPLNGMGAFEVRDQLFMYRVIGNKVLIDTASYEDMGEIPDGPMAGQRLMMPRGDSDR
jgi:hypothetical protein